MQKLTQNVRLRQVSGFSGTDLLEFAFARATAWLREH